MEDRFKFLVIPLKNGSFLKAGLKRTCFMILALFFAIGFVNVIYATEMQQHAMKLSF